MSGDDHDQRATDSATAIGLAFVEALDRLRDDVREDLALLEGRLMSIIAAHGREHDGLNEAQATFAEFIETSKLAQARREGALGVFRYALELLSRHAKPIVATILSLALAGLALAGRLDVSVGVR